MTRFLAILVCLFALAPGVALGGGQDLNWDDCVLAPTNVKHFACDRNTGFDVLVGSFEPFEAVPDMVGLDAAMDLVFRDGYVPSWWQLQNGGCRVAGLSVNGAFSGTACLDPWQSSPVGLVSGVVPAFEGNPARLRISITMAVPYSAAFAVAPGTVYYGYQLQIRRGSTVGPGACSGCELPAIIVPAYTRLVGANSPEQFIYPTLSGSWLCWQCNCGYDDAGLYFDPACGVTAIPARTWGSIKSLYR